MAWALQEIQLHQQAERQGVPQAALKGDRPRPGDLAPRCKTQC